MKKVKQAMIKDLTKGNPVKVLIVFALPMLLSMVFQQMYNLADSIVAGNFGGVKALGALSASTPVTNLFVAIAVGGTLGSSVVISNLFGAKDYKKLKTTISTAIISLIVIAFICTIVGIFIVKPILEILNTPENVMQDAKSYLQIYIFGFFFLFIYNIANAIFTGLGDSKTTLYLLIGSSVSNIGLDIAFAYLFNNVVLGVAWATFIAQSIASMVAILLLIHRLKSIGLLMVQSLVNGYGTEVLDGYATALKINSLAIMSIFTLANSMSSYTAQNLGNQDIERVKKGYHIMLILSLSLIAFIVFIVLIFSKQIISLFIQGTEGEDIHAVIKAGQRFLILVVPFYFFVTIKIISDGVLRGAKQMKAFMFCTLLDLVIRVGVSYALSTVLGYDAIGVGFEIGWVISMIASFLCYFSYMKKMKHSILAMTK